MHGEVCSIELSSRLSDGRHTSVSRRIDPRTGGSVSVTVRGVLDALALADRFVAP